MICNNCGFENPENSKFCAYCGSPLLRVQNLPAGKTGRMRRLLNDKLFLTMCILYSVSVVGGIVALHLPILTILTMIFLWLVFAQSRKNIIAGNYLRCISGTIFASYVINWVLYGFIALLSLIFAIFPGFTGTSSKLLSKLLSAAGLYEGIVQCAVSSIVILLSVLLILISAGGILLNIFGRRSIHRFAQSVYRNAENNNIPVVMHEKAQIWMMVFGILSAISAISNFTLFIEHASKAAALIIGSILIKKHLS